MEFHVGSSEDLSAFAPESFDVVYLNSVLVWVADKPTALAQARRVLARGGRLGIATTVREPPNELRLLIRDAKDEAMGRPGRRLRRRTMSPGGQADLLAGAGRRVTPGGVRGLLQASGFSIRVCELRTYLSEFEDVAGIISFLRATSFGRMLSDMTSTDLARFAAALERVIADEIPASRRTGGIRLERHVLLAVAEKS
jgi:trans-aconitate methyltransferase